MKRSLSNIGVAILCCAAAGARADTTLVECTYAGGDKAISQIVPTPGTYHYKLLLPDDYQEESDQRYPVMFIASPGGNAGMGPMAERLKRDRWVVVMLMESKNGPDEPATANFLAAHDDVIERVRIIEGMKFCTGLSGGARASSFNAAWRPGFGGAIFQAAGFLFHPTSSKGRDFVSRYPRGFLLCGLFGNTDYNFNEYYETDRVRRDSPPAVRPHVEVYEGGHQWASAACFGRAMDWIEEELFARQETRPSEDACLWFFTILRERLGRTSDPMQRLCILESLCAVSKKLGMTKQAAMRAEVRDYTTEASQLMRGGEIADELKARDAYRKAMQTHEKFCSTQRQTPSVYKAQLLPQKEKALLQQVVSALEDVTQRYHQSLYGRHAAERLTALRLEYGSHLTSN